MATRNLQSSAFFTSLRSGVPFGLLALATAEMLSGCGGSNTGNSGGLNVDSGSVVTADSGTPPPAASSADVAQPGGILVIRIGGSEAGVNHDVLAVAGNAELAGTLSLQFTDGYVPPAGQRFALIRASSISGAFATVTSTPPRSLTTSRDSTTFYVTVNQ